MNDLAVSAAQALVQSMTTSAWNEVRSRVSAIFKRHKSGRRLNDELYATFANLMVDPSNRESEIPRWAVMLQALADSSTDAAADIVLMNAFLNQIITGQGRRQVTQTGFAQRDQYNVQGNLTINNS